jgi:hypothetical protein
MESVVFLLFLSSIISMIKGTNQEPWIQNVNLCFLLTDSAKKNPKLGLFYSETHFLVESASKIFSFIKAMKIPNFE